jgi:hypothetical protein
MTFERTGAFSAGDPAPPASGVPTASGVPPAEPASPGLRLQILATEHWSLLATRSLAWNEVFARAGTFLTTLSGAIVALALVGQGSGFDDTFLVFGVVILAVVLFVGVATFLRMGASNYYDAQCVIGMNRIRAAYLELAPDLERYFVMSAHDDVRGLGITMGVPPGTAPLVHIIAATPTVVSVVDSVVAAAVVGMLVLLTDAATPGVLAACIATFLVVFLLHVRYGRQAVARGQASVRTIFPGH